MAMPDPAEATMWTMIEAAWKPRGAKINALRVKLATRDPDDEDDGDDDDVEVERIDAVLEDVIAALTAAFNQLPQDELAAIDRVLERRLYDIDRQEIQEITDGSDDGFLYARGFIVVLGQAFYDAVNANPAVALMDAECEEMCYLPANVYN